MESNPKEGTAFQKAPGKQVCTDGTIGTEKELESEHGGEEQTATPFQQIPQEKTQTLDEVNVGGLGVESGVLCPADTAGRHATLTTCPVECDT
jgi:hypothetical protein